MRFEKECVSLQSEIVIVNIMDIWTIVGVVIGVAGIFIPLLVSSDKFKKRHYLKWQRSAVKYHKDLDTDKYIEWRDCQLKKIYGDVFFTNVFGKEHPSFTLSFAENVGTNDLCNSENICLDDVKIVDDGGDRGVELPKVTKLKVFSCGSFAQRIRKKVLYRKYKYIIEGSGRYQEGSVTNPELLGFSINNYGFDGDGRVTAIHAKIGTYLYNIYTSHILEYELFRVYKRFGDKRNLSVDKLWKQLPFRYYVHFGNSKEASMPNRDIIVSGVRRYSLLSVQCIIVFRDAVSNKYSTFLIKRSEDPDKVSAKLGYYQFPPAGGFELFENEHVKSIDTIYDHYSLELALYREYLEEVFNFKEFKNPPVGNIEPIEMITKHKELRSLNEMIEAGKARLELLGITVEIVSMRHNVSFALIIDDPDYSNKLFELNEEFSKKKSRIRIPINEVEKEMAGKKIVDDSALLFKMFKEKHPEFF